MTAAAPHPAVPHPATPSSAASRRAFGIGPDGTYTRLGQTVAFVLGLLTMVAFFPCLFVSALLYARAEERFADDPERARTLVNWSWIGITVPVAAGAAAAAIVAAVTA
ncbi:hypothetical protein [Actinomadura rifamycini]|uniref:hypothetical protein n=1 Tax=Actinomadura rifamycini TaxID=31962 RepID=UPI0004296384|nr:hypothetical protein [Actinomadura rifamycini]